VLVSNDYEAGPRANLQPRLPARVSASHTPDLVIENDPRKANMKRKAQLDMWNNRRLKIAEPRLHALIDTFLSAVTSHGDEIAADTKSAVDLTELDTSFEHGQTSSGAHVKKHDGSGRVLLADNEISGQAGFHWISGSDRDHDAD
jgi:hypothetical protein